jgi:hypothetical protein
MDVRKIGRRAAAVAAAVVVGGAACALERGGWTGEGGGAAGWRGGPEWRWHGASCERGARLDHALGAVRESLALAPAQRPAWDGFAAAVTEATASWDAACAAEAPGAASPTRAFARAEAALAWLAAVRPAHEALAAALDERQRRALESWWERRHR